MRALAVLLLLALAGSAAAQAPPALPTDPSVTVALAQPEAGKTVALETAQAIPLTVTVTLTNLVCQGATTIPVALALTETPVAGVTTSLPATLEVPVAAGNYIGTTVGSGSAQTNITFTVSKGAPGDHDHKVTVTASTPGAVPSGCNAISVAPPAPSQDAKDVAIRTGAAPPAGTATPTSTSSAPSTTQESFFLPLQAQLAILMLAALALRRRR